MKNILIPLNKQFRLIDPVELNQARRKQIHIGGGAVPVAQSVARSTLDREVVSSSRAGCTGRFPVLRMRQ